MTAVPFSSAVGVSSLGPSRSACKKMSRTLSRVWRLTLAALLCVVVLKLAIAAPYRPFEPLPPDILDMHCHVAGIGAGGSGCFVSEKLRHSWRFAVYLRCFGVSADEVEKKGDGLIADHISETLAQSRYVKKAVMLALDGVVTNGALDQTRTEVYVPNEFV